MAKVLSQSSIDNMFDTQCREAIHLSAINDQLQAWLAASYTKDKDAILGYYQEIYIAGRQLDQDPDGFDYYSLLDESGKFMLEIEVYDDGDTEFYCTVLHHKSVISSMWPTS